jgi:hypothetical protein
MARYRVLAWRGIPAQLKVYGESGRPRSVKLADWYVQEIDRVAMREGIVGTDEYLALWQWSKDVEREGSVDDVAAAVVAEIDAEWRPSAAVRDGGSE